MKAVLLALVVIALVWGAIVYLDAHLACNALLSSGC